MKKIILIFCLCLFNPSANAGLKEIGQGQVGTDIKNQYDKKLIEATSSAFGNVKAIFT